MNISDFISRYENHPVLFIGTGVSLRYLTNSYTWDGLLSKIAFDLKENEEYYFDLKASCQIDGSGKYSYEKLASKLEEEFNHTLINERNGKFKEINDIFYAKMKEDSINVSRFKIYISILLGEINYREALEDELVEFKKIRKNIGSIITTNYDGLIEDVFEFNKLIGNDILLSNPYGSVYKIHGCIDEADKIIITQNDYDVFDEKYDLIRAQLLSLFIHNPIIFLGYNVGDENIKKILKTIFTYVEPNSELASKIRDNFLLVEYDSGNQNVDISEHDIDMEGFSTVRINKLKTDNYKAIYEALANIHLPISAMDVRKVQSVVKEIYSGGEIKVTITEDLDTLKNGAKILAIGSSKTISYNYQSASEMMTNYFKIIDESNSQILTLIEHYKIQKAQYFPIFGFSTINNSLSCIRKLKIQQETNLGNTFKAIDDQKRQLEHDTIQAILEDATIAVSFKTNAIIWNVMEDKLELEDVESYLRNFDNKNDTEYRKILCAFDMKMYN
ncbi:MAG: SIR2 family protein [Marinilabiliaceae bacterium]|nr:SIR2 family protein [Marinilabiliaceae bacterium]